MASGSGSRPCSSARASMSTAMAIAGWRARTTCGSKRTSCRSAAAASFNGRTSSGFVYAANSMIEEPKINRNLALELLRVTEAGALAAAPLQGRGNKEAADARAVEAIRSALASVDMKGTVVIGEGEKDEAPMLYFGEPIGNGLEPELDVAVDPIEGTSLTASGLPGAISVVALAERGTMFTTHAHYMQKLVVGRRARGVIDLEMPVEWNLRRIAKAEGLPVQELTVVVLERDRNNDVIAQIRDVGARIKLITAGHVAAALEAALETRSVVHCMMGSGGATEGVLAACAIKTIGGDMQAKLHFRDDKEKEMAIKEGHTPGKVLCLDDLCSGNDICVAATGSTSGGRVKGVRYEDVYAYTQSMVLRSASGTMRIVDAYHPIEKLRAKGLLPEQVAVRCALRTRDSSWSRPANRWAPRSGSGSQPPGSSLASGLRRPRSSRCWKACWPEPTRPWSMHSPVAFVSRKPSSQSTRRSPTLPPRQRRSSRPRSWPSRSWCGNRWSRRSSTWSTGLSQRSCPVPVTNRRRPSIARSSHSCVSCRRSLALRKPRSRRWPKP